MELLGCMKPRLYLYCHFLQGTEMQVPLKQSKALEKDRTGGHGSCSMLVNVQKCYYHYW